jgi:hypothetical protein
MTQTEFITLLFEQIGYDTVSQRKGWMQRNFSKNHADELDSRERSMAFEALKDEKAAKRGY